MQIRATYPNFPLSVAKLKHLVAVGIRHRMFHVFKHGTDADMTRCILHVRHEYKITARWMLSAGSIERGWLPQPPHPSLHNYLVMQINFNFVLLSKY